MFFFSSWSKNAGGQRQSKLAGNGEKQQTRRHSYADGPLTREHVSYWQLYKKNHVCRHCRQPQPWSKVPDRSERKDRAKPCRCRGIGTRVCYQLHPKAPRLQRWSRNCVVKHFLATPTPISETHYHPGIAELHCNHPLMCLLRSSTRAEKASAVRFLFLFRRILQVRVILQIQSRRVPKRT